jgi:hypothetical protein
MGCSRPRAERPRPTKEAPVVVAGVPVMLAQARALYPCRVVASCDDEGERARMRLRVDLKRTAPRVLRRTSFDFDCDPQTFQTRYRADIVVVFHAIARIAEDVRRR